MSQDYITNKGKNTPARDATNDDASKTSPSSSRPHYMTVGTGSASAHAARLQAMLDEDSGYGGSAAGDDTAALDLAMQPDRPVLPVTNGVNGQPSDAERRTQATAVHQLWYNQHKVSLGRAIGAAVKLLSGLQEVNVKWPAHYPLVQRAEVDSPERPSSRPGFSHTLSMVGDLQSSSASPITAAPPLRRSMTTVDENVEAESSSTAEKRPTDAPRLVTPQIAQEFSVLKLDLKLGALHHAELVHSLEKGSIASLLDGKISSSIRHLLSLLDRIEDTSSKVLVTGDLNAGKSTFCNALLRRKVLPEDQQPCTAIFCEVLDARENAGVEEVHAVHMDAKYDRGNENTYDVYTLQELEKIVTDNTRYMQCKVYVKDIRTVGESLLSNGVVDIALIDAPGLNSDTTKTTAVFARQEEIDVVVFVVSASNHFTISAQEFIMAAAAEKAYLFIVVNGFDTIKDKERCEKMILKQVFGLSPRTFKESSELVHFVSSNAVPMASPPGGPGGSGTASGGGGDPSDDPNDKGKDVEKIRDFERLEESLRRFVLEKRARSKLAPAKNYLLNILNDVNVLANVNSDVAQSELDRVEQMLNEIEPQLESSTKAKNEIAEETDKTIEEICKEVYDYTRSTLNSAIAHAGDNNLGVPYPGLFNAFNYAEELKEAMLSHIADSVASCEEHARTSSVKGVNVIKQLGLLHLGNEYESLNFRPDVMFRRRRDALARQIDIPTELWDFIDWSALVQGEKVAGTGMALTVATAVGGRLIGFNTWVDQAFMAVRVMGNDNLRRLIIPGIVVAALAMTAYILRQIPTALPHRLSTKVATQLAAIDYVHANATRISGSVRKVVRFPADHLRSGLDRSVEELGKRRKETLRVQDESAVALKYFGNLVRDSARQKSVVENIDLEAPPPGAAGYH